MLGEEANLQLFLRHLTKSQTSDFPTTLANGFSTICSLTTKNLRFTIATENFLGCVDGIPPSPVF
jgi:hypothetical protein